MIRARRALYAHLRGFMESRLAGLYGWDDIGQGVDLPSELGKYGRRNPLGRWKEIVEITFGDYTLRIASSEERPPLGWVQLELNRIEIDSGPIDQHTWNRLGTLIRDRANKEKDHVGHTRRAIGG